MIPLNTTINASIEFGSMTTQSIVQTVKPLAFIIVAIAIYAVFIFNFYRFLAERDILKLKLSKTYEFKESFFHKFFRVTLYLIEHVFLVPVIVFFWFVVLAALLLFLSKNSPSEVLLISMAIIGAVRVTAYYNQDLSRDLSKMIPFALLGVVIIDLSYVSIASSMSLGKELLLFLDKFLFYFLFIVALELLMRIIRVFKQLLRPKWKQHAESMTEKARTNYYREQ